MFLVYFGIRVNIFDISGEHIQFNYYLVPFDVPTWEPGEICSATNPQRAQSQASGWAPILVLSTPSTYTY